MLIDWEHLMGRGSGEGGERGPVTEGNRVGLQGASGLARQSREDATREKGKLWALKPRHIRAGPGQARLRLCLPRGIISWLL